MPFLNQVKNDGVKGRQLAFFGAFVLPISKLVETPSLLSKYAQGDLLLPALLHFILQTAVLCLILFCLSRLQKPLGQIFQERLGKWKYAIYLPYALFFLFFAVLPLLDLEKFVHAVFYDTPPTLFTFLFFFPIVAFLCCKGLKTVGRFSDLSLFLFLAPFLLLIIFSLEEADITGLLPLFEKPFQNSLSACKVTVPHFADALLYLPLLLNYRYQKGDGKKIIGGYAVGGFFTLLFLAVFYGVYSTIAFKQRYAFSKIAQYFPALATVGRIDLLLVYILCIVLFVYTALPLFYATVCFSRPFKKAPQPLIGVIITLLALLFTLFFNRRYDSVYELFTQKLFWLYLLFGSVLPLALFLFKRKTRYEK